MSFVTFECAAPLCKAAFGVANPDPWDTDLALADEMGWVIGWGLTACCDEHLTLGRVATLVTPAAIQAALFAANNVASAQYCEAGLWMSVAAKRDSARDRFCIENALEHGLLAWSYSLERDQLRREAAALAVA
jgi:hypothetical protein